MGKLELAKDIATIAAAAAVVAVGVKSLTPERTKHVIVEHKFPEGFDPHVAATIVKANTLTE